MMDSKKRKKKVTKDERYVRGKFVLTLDVQSTDTCYEWLLEWLAEQPLLINTRRLGVESSYVTSKENAVCFFHPLLFFFLNSFHKKFMLFYFLLLISSYFQSFILLSLS